MALKTLTFLLVASGAAVAMYRLGQRSTLSTASPPLDELANDELSPLDMVTPNQSERLQDRKLLDAGYGSSVNASDEDLFPPPRNDAQPSDAIKPGVPDFSRGS